uniref:Uncharacterized protein n=1 Tax=Oryza sativa subsp. japonica TaxID=39947 RepID=Q75J77_ORYSJ|nr:hypothetical protein [Oryza sativa Japonica Group]
MANIPTTFRVSEPRARPERKGGSAELNGPAGPRRWPKAAQDARARWKERESPVDRAHHARSRVGPACQLLGSPCGGSTRRGARVEDGRGARTRFAVDAGAAGPRAASRLAVERAHGEGLTGVGSTRFRLSWRRCGAYVAATRAGERGDEPTARICRGLLDGGGLRRRQPAAGEGGNGDERRIGRNYAERGRRRAALPSSGGDGGEHTASDGNGRGGAG